MTLEQAQQAALQKSQQLNDAKLKLDCDQTGWGLTIPANSVRHA